MGDVRHVLNQARGDSHVTVGDAGRSLGQQHADDTAIVQNVGAPYAALQWRKEDSVNHCRCDKFTLSELTSRAICCKHFGCHARVSIVHLHCGT